MKGRVSVSGVTIPCTVRSGQGVKTVIEHCKLNFFLIFLLPGKIPADSFHTVVNAVIVASAVVQACDVADCSWDAVGSPVVSGQVEALVGSPVERNNTNK